MMMMMMAFPAPAGLSGWSALGGGGGGGAREEAAGVAAADWLIPGQVQVV